MNECIPEPWRSRKVLGPDTLQWPWEVVFASTTPDGEPDRVTAEARAADAALPLFLLGFDVEIVPRVIAGHVLSDSCVLRIHRPAVVA